MANETNEFDDPESQQIFLGHWNSGTASRNIVHGFQLVQADKFQEFDYGKLGNMQEYGQILPPVYDSEKIIDAEIPIAFFAANGDMTIKTKDQRWLYNLIKPVVVHYQEVNGGHLTFSSSKDVSWFS